MHHLQSPSAIPFSGASYSVIRLVSARTLRGGRWTVRDATKLRRMIKPWTYRSVKEPERTQRLVARPLRVVPSPGELILRVHSGQLVTSMCGVKNGEIAHARLQARLPPRCGCQFATSMKADNHLCLASIHALPSRRAPTSMVTQDPSCILHQLLRERNVQHNSVGAGVETTVKHWPEDGDRPATR